MMTNNQVISDFTADFSTSNGSATVRENGHSGHADEVR
jgi:hypothetical protein